MIPTIAFTLSLVATVASFALAVRAHRAGRGKLTVSGTVWGAILTALQVFLVVWSALGLVANDLISSVLAAAALAGAACASFNRAAVVKRLSSFDHPLAVALIALVLGAVMTTLALEIPSNHDLTYMYPLCLLLEACLILAVQAGLFFLTQRHGSPSAAVAVALWFVGIAQYFVITFKTMPITPSDLFALNTAAAVAGTGYTYSLTAFCLYSLVFLAGAVTLTPPLGSLATAQRLAAGSADAGAEAQGANAAAQGIGLHAKRPAPAKAPRRRRAIAVNALVGLALLAGVTAHVTLIDYYHTLSIQVYTWRPLESYYRQGFLPSFISNAQLMVPQKPKGYDADETDAIREELAADYAEDPELGASPDRAAAEQQFSETKPSVVVVMNETFSDLSIYQNMHAGYEGPQYFKSLQDTLLRGDLYVSAYGGGTCNTEWEFLTGSSMAYMGTGLYPYMVYNQRAVPSLVKQFSEMGYTTTAMHPNHANNWNRENVYRDLGFDNFLSIDDFEGAETLRGMVTDGSTDDKVLEQLQSSSDPQFIFDVTMQNHSGYDTGLIPSSKLEHYAIDGEENPEVNEYLSLIEQSDRDLEEFINELRELDRPVVVVFFGDPQPSFPDTYNDLWFTGEDEGTHTERLWHTQYFVWANYDVAGNAQTSQQIDTSTNYLAALMMQAIGAPLTESQEAELALRKQLPLVNVIGYQGADGVWHLNGQEDDSLATELYNQLWAMQYRALFDNGEPVFTLSQQTEANETNPNLAPGTTAVPGAL